MVEVRMERNPSIRRPGIPEIQAIGSRAGFEKIINHQVDRRTKDRKLQGEIYEEMKREVNLLNMFHFEASQPPNISIFFAIGYFDILSVVSIYYFYCLDFSMQWQIQVLLAITNNCLIFSHVENHEKKTWISAFGAVFNSTSGRNMSSIPLLIFFKFQLIRF